MTVISRFSERTLYKSSPPSCDSPATSSATDQESFRSPPRLVRLSEGLAVDTCDSGRKPDLDWPEQKRELVDLCTQESGSTCCLQARLDPGAQAVRESGFPLPVSGSASWVLGPLSGRLSTVAAGGSSGLPTWCSPLAERDPLPTTPQEKGQFKDGSAEHRLRATGQLQRQML